MKKGRHRRYEEARALKRGPDLDIEGILDDMSGGRDSGPSDDPDDFDVLQADGPPSAADGPDASGDEDEDEAAG